MPKIDAIYARYSSHAQDDGTSIEVQLEQCERAAGGKCQHYIDRAKTGRAVGGRTQLIALLADAEAGKIGRVFVYKFDRLGRNADTHIIAQQLEDAGVELISATEGTNELARGIQLVVAEDYSRQLAKRTRDGLIKRFEQGAFTGGIAPYGYQVVTTDNRRTLQVNPEEAAIVRDVFRWYIHEAIGMKGIAKRLRDKGIKSRRGKGWSFTSVRLVLLNNMFTGRVRFNQRKMHLDRSTGRRVPRQKIASEHLERQDDALRIIDDETFGQAAERLAKAARGATPRESRGLAPFTGLVYCECGCKAYRERSQNKKGDYFYYVCSRQTRYGDCPYGSRIREDELMGKIQRTFHRTLAKSELIIARAIEIAQQATQANRVDADRIKAEMRGVDAKAVRLTELLMDRAIPEAAKATIGRQLADVEAERNHLQQALDALREESQDRTDELAETVREAFEDLREGLGTVDPAAFNHLVDRFVGPLVIGPAHQVYQKQLPQAEAQGKLDSTPESNPTRVIAGGRYARHPQTLSSVRHFAIISARAVFWAYLRKVA